MAGFLNGTPQKSKNMQNLNTIKSTLILFLVLTNIAYVMGQRAFSVELRGHTEIDNRLLSIDDGQLPNHGIGILFNQSFDKKNKHQIKIGLIGTLDRYVYSEKYTYDPSTGFDVFDTFTSKTYILSIPCFYVFSTKHFYAEAGAYANWKGYDRNFIGEKLIPEYNSSFSYPASSIKAHLGVGYQYWYKLFGIKIGVSFNTDFKSARFPVASYFYDLNIGLAYQFQKKQNE